MGDRVGHSALDHRGRLDEAGACVERAGVTADDEPAYMREFDHLTLARLLLARRAAGSDASALGNAGGLLRRLLPAAQAGGRTGSAIEILTLTALVHQAEGDTPRALAALEQALTLAEPEGFLRIFVDEGQPLHSLLRHATARGLWPIRQGAAAASLDERSHAWRLRRGFAIESQPTQSRRYEAF